MELVFYFPIVNDSHCWELTGESLQKYGLFVRAIYSNIWQCRAAICMLRHCLACARAPWYNSQVARKNSIKIRTSEGPRDRWDMEKWGGMIWGLLWHGTTAWLCTTAFKGWGKTHLSTVHEQEMTSSCLFCSALLLFFFLVFFHLFYFVIS